MNGTGRGAAPGHGTAQAARLAEQLKLCRGADPTGGAEPDPGEKIACPGDGEKSCGQSQAASRAAKERVVAPNKLAVSTKNRFGRYSEIERRKADRARAGRPTGLSGALGTHMEGMPMEGTPTEGRRRRWSPAPSRPGARRTPPRSHTFFRPARQPPEARLRPQGLSLRLLSLPGPSLTATAVRPARRLRARHARRSGVG